MIKYNDYIIIYTGISNISIIQSNIIIQYVCVCVCVCVVCYYNIRLNYIYILDCVCVCVRIHIIKKLYYI